MDMIKFLVTNASTNNNTLTYIFLTKTQVSLQVEFRTSTTVHHQSPNGSESKMYREPCYVSLSLALASDSKASSSPFLYSFTVSASQHQAQTVPTMDISEVNEWFQSFGKSLCERKLCQKKVPVQPPMCLPPGHRKRYVSLTILREYPRKRDTNRTRLQNLQMTRLHE